MADRPVTAAVGTAQQGQGVVKRFFELLMMLVSMVLVIFAWGEASKAKDEAASLRGELRLARSEQADRRGTQCNVCLDNPRETVLQPCGHVCMCLQCATRVQQGEKQCPVCRARIEKVSQAYISWTSIQHLSENIFEALKTCDNQPLDLIIEHHFVGRLKCVHLKDKVILFNISKGWTRAWKIVFIKPFFLSLLRLYFYPELWNLLCTCKKCVR